MIEDVEEWETKSDIYKAVAQYCKDAGFVTPSDSIFFKELKKHVYYHGGQKTIKGQRVRVLLGVKLIGDAQEARSARDVIPNTPLTDYSKGSEGVHPVYPVSEDQLFVDASRLLEINGGSMEQRLFFSALTNIGYNQQQARGILRADSRLAFRGMDVISMHGETEA